MLQQLIKIIILPCDDDQIKITNGGIKRKLKLREMNHHSNRRRGNNYRNVMIQTKFLLLSVMLTICILIPYGRSLTISFYCISKIMSKCKYNMIHISFVLCVLVHVQLDLIQSHLFIYLKFILCDS